MDVLSRIGKALVQAGLSLQETAPQEEVKLVVQEMKAAVEQEAKPEPVKAPAEVAAVPRARRARKLAPAPAPEPEVEEEEPEPVPEVKPARRVRRAAAPVVEEKEEEAEEPAPAPRRRRVPAAAAATPTLPKPSELPKGDIDGFIAGLEGRAALKKVIQDYKLGISLAARSESSLRKAIKSAFLDGKFDPFVAMDPQEGDVDEDEVESYEEEPVDPEEDNEDSVAELAQELQEHFVNDVNGDAASWKMQQKCNLICTKCRPELINRCGDARFLPE